jgi:uncharacterized protein (DUF1501 family)
MKRRRFLGQANCAAISSLPILNTLLNLKLAGSVAAADPPPASEYRALVCIFLNGGLDSFNMLTPRGAEHAAYASVRQDLALSEASLLPINPLNTPGRSFGLHPQMPQLQALFENGNAAFVANVGTLIEPVTLAEYQANSKPLPLRE